MTVATSPDIVRFYEKVFSLDNFTDDDRERVSFLERIVTGEIPTGNTPLSVAAETVRQWFENPAGPVKYHRMLAKVSDAPECRAVFYKFKECVQVLKDYRLEELFEQYREALETRNHDQVDATERLIKGFEDAEAVKQMQALKASYIETKRYKLPKPEGEVSWGYVTAISAAAAVIITAATLLAMSGNKPSTRTDQRVENKQQPDTSQIEKPDYLGQR